MHLTSFQALLKTNIYFSILNIRYAPMFRPCPVLQNQPLPFAVAELDFLKWLKALSSTDDKASCELLLQVLQTLNRTAMAGKTRLLFLEKLGGLVLQLSDRLTKLAFAENNELMPEGLQQFEKAVWCCAQLAEGYMLLSKADDFKDKLAYSLAQKSLIISRGIQAMSKALLYISQSYTVPYPHFWLSCLEFYQLAQQHQLTDADNPSADLINNAFKQLVVFSLSNTNQFSQQEMSIIYDLLHQYSEYVRLLPPASAPASKIPFICLDKDAPPAKRYPADHKPTSRTLYIATAGVAGKLLETMPDKTQAQNANTRLMLLRLVKTLSMNQQRKHTRERAQGAFYGIIDFNNIINSLRGDITRQDREVALSGYFDVANPGELRDLNFTIANNDEEELRIHSKLKSQKANPSTFKIIEVNAPEEIWKEEAPDLLAANTSLIDKSKKGYSILSTNSQIQPKVGHLIGLNHKQLALGIIRWVARSQEFRVLMGIELLGAHAQAVRISNPGFPDLEADGIYLPADEALEKSESLILLNSAFKPAEFFFILKKHRNIRYRMIKVLHSTALIKHFEVLRT